MTTSGRYELAPAREPLLCRIGLHHNCPGRHRGEPYWRVRLRRWWDTPRPSGSYYWDVP